MIHPGLANQTGTTAAIWRGMQDALSEGLTRSIGVSNFNSTQLDELVAQPTTTVIHPLPPPKDRGRLTHQN